MPKKKYQRNWLERKLDEYNHTMELIRTILPFFDTIATNLHTNETHLTLS